MSKENIITTVIFIIFLIGFGYGIHSSATAEVESLQRNIKKFGCREAGITNLGRDYNQKVYQCWDGRFHTAEELARL